MIKAVFSWLSVTTQVTCGVQLCLLASVPLWVVERMNRDAIC